MMKRFILLLCFLVLLTLQDLFPQSKTDSKNSFFDAESWILFEAYKDALPIYLELDSQYPDNANFKYRIGQCYLNSPGEKDKAVPYLEEAVKNIDPDYREGKFSEPGAPYVALYYLANAYRINNKLDKAIEVYRRFKQVLDPGVYDTTVVNRQIQTCLNAKQLIEKPQPLTEHSLGDVINQDNSEYNPVVSDDETMIVFSRIEPFYDALMYSVKKNGQWKEPMNMNEILQVDRDIFPTSLSSDGHTLYLYSSADYDGIIYSSNYVDGTWTLPVKLNDNINTKYWESHATVSHDNNRLYFTSNRQGTYGGLDIYVSKRESNGDWGPASNLGPVINTPFNEESPFLTRDDKTLFFSSKGHYNMGGYDIFYSDLLPDGKWSEPVNVGYPLNTTDDDVFYKPSVDKYRGFYSFISSDDQGKRDIYEVEFYPQDRPRIFTITGKSGVEGISGYFSDSIKITVINIRQPSRQKVFYTNPKTQIYRFDLPEGEYRLTYEGYGGTGITKDIKLPKNYPHDKFIIPDTELQKTDLTADLSVESDKMIIMTGNDSIVLIPLRVEPESMLSVQEWNGDKLLASENHFIKTTGFNFSLKPEFGETRVLFRLTDRFSNRAEETVLIKRPAPKGAAQIIRPERAGVISGKQVDAYISLLKQYGNEDLVKVISESGIEKEKFSTVDEMLVSLKNEAARKNISAEEIDKLTLKIALTDNVLTQTSVDLLAGNADPETGKILSGLDIYEAELTTWSGLLRWVEDTSSGTIRSDDIDALAQIILGGIDPAITIIREKILAFSEVSAEGPSLRSSVSAADSSGIRQRGNWLGYVYDESLGRNLNPGIMAGMLAALSSAPGTGTDQYLASLAENSEEPLNSSMKSLDPDKAGISSPEELVLFLLQTADSVKYPREQVFKSIASLIAAENISAQTIRTQSAVTGKGSLWIVWIAAGIVLAVVVILLIRSRKKK